MSLTINTKQFDENYNDPEPNTQRLDVDDQYSETQQFTIDEQQADETVKQYPSRRSKASRKDASPPVVRKQMSENSNQNSSTIKQNQRLSSSKQQKQGDSIQDNYGLDRDSPHGGMFDQPDIEDSKEDNYNLRDSRPTDIANQESFQNNTLPQRDSQEGLPHSMDIQDQGEIDDQEGEEPMDEDDQDQEDQEYSPQNQQQPLLFVDINLGGDEQERIVVYEGDTAVQLALNFCQEHNLDEETQEKLQELLEQQMAGVLPKVDEEEYNSEDEEDEERYGQENDGDDRDGRYGDEDDDHQR